MAQDEPVRGDSMAGRAAQRQDFTIAAVVQSGRLAYEAILLAASLRHSDPGFSGRLFLMEPQPGPFWRDDPRVHEGAILAALADLGAEIVPFQSRVFGASYPQGNKMEGLAALPEGPFLFLDSDTLVTGPLGEVPFDFSCPAASMRREGTWPAIELYGPGYSAIWGSLYAKFGLDMEPTLDPTQPAEYWQRHLYFNAGWFFGADPFAFGARFTAFAQAIRDDPPPELLGQALDPWLDQIALPLVVASFGGGRPGPELSGLDGDVTCHWRALPLLYAREPDRVVEVLEAVSAPNRIKKVLKGYEPFRQFLYQGKGRRARTLFDRTNLPRREQAIRNTLKREGLWMR